MDNSTRSRTAGRGTASGAGEERTDHLAPRARGPTAFDPTAVSGVCSTLATLGRVVPDTPRGADGV